ncbi:MAG TPA: hypothetical protein VFV66_23570 [Nonomuraea sp.]|nr:hypothetical protein [Nonomuraea sp.]
MATDAVGVQHFSSGDVGTWFQAGEVDMAVGDVIAPPGNAAMSVGYAHYRKGASNAWTVTYDEALIITRGLFSVRSGETRKTAAVGELIYLHAGTPVVYEADEDTTLIYVCYPALGLAPVAGFHSVDGATVARLAG